MDDWYVPKRPFSRLQVGAAFTGGLLVLGVAGLLTFLATPDGSGTTRVEVSIDCGGNGLLLVSGLVAALVGACFMVLGFQRALEARSWSSALVGVFGVCLLAYGVAAVVLHQRTDWVCTST